MTTRMLCVIAVLLAGPHPILRTTLAASPSGTPATAVNAWLSTAGPYGEGWELIITAEADAALEVMYLGNPSGSLLARWRLDDEALAAIRQAVDAQHFWELPSEITKPMVALHRPDLRLDIRVGERHHKVALYDPGELKGDVRADRFLKVWAAVYKGLPLKPTW